MFISSQFHLGQYRDHDHREDAPHFTWCVVKLKKSNGYKDGELNEDYIDLGEFHFRWFKLQHYQDTDDSSKSYADSVM